ncbi:MAG: 2,3-bisphosphoglycerate-independent phosphoglycerate mutase [Myxococcales bacterium]|nr:2,3-bisphosphoglycerate-independent phosphoglycerate mutase [Myxococcales bacterium]
MATTSLLDAHARLRPPRGPLVLAILDGVGWGPADGGDAVHLAHKPNLARLWQTFPTRTLRAHGTAVGMPSDADMGNSEVGHNALGAGRVFRQGAALVGDAIASGRLFSGDTWHWLVAPLVGPGATDTATLHLCGLYSTGNVHAHCDHVDALLRAAHAAGVRRVRVHVLADGRDVPDATFERDLERLEHTLDGYRAQNDRDWCIASGGGRMVVTMDRYEADWSIVERGWHAHVLGDAPGFPSARDAVATLRLRTGGHSDQTLGAFTITDATGAAVGPVRDGDAFVLWNFRGDRAIQLTQAFEAGADFAGFERHQVPQVRYAGMMQYDGDLSLPRRYLVEPPVIERTVGEFLGAAGLRTFAVSETQKYGHVTYFWNGNRSGVLDPAHETYEELPSDRIAFDLRPEMQARAITDAVERALRGPQRPDFVRLNYPNGDMVGHTGNLAATILAIEAIDGEIGRLIGLVEARRGILIVTADHGNADDMWLRDGKGLPLLNRAGLPTPRTSHTLAPVPFTIFDADADHAATWRLRSDLPSAGLANVAATLLALLGWSAPPQYEEALVEVSGLELRATA